MMLAPKLVIQLLQRPAVRSHTVHNGHNVTWLQGSAGWCISSKQAPLRPETLLTRCTWLKRAGHKAL